MQIRRVLVAFVAAAVSAGIAAPTASGSEAERIHRTTNFSITWVDDPASRDAPDLTDADDDGLPDAIERLAMAFEEARTFLLHELGYLPPPVEGRYHIYVADGSGAYIQTMPGDGGDSKPSYIVVTPRTMDLTPWDKGLRAIAVHEYFHAIQNGYNSSTPSWIKEASSAWVEALFVDEPSSVALSAAFIPLPRLSLHDGGNAHRYGAFVFLRFLTERYASGGRVGAPLVRELWEEMAVPEVIPGAPARDALDAVRAVLARRGVSLADAWGEFLLWRRQLGRFEQGSLYRAALTGGPAWPSVLRSTRVRAESCRLTTDLQDGALPSLSGDYVRLEPHRYGPARVRARVSVRGPEGATGFILRKPRGAPRYELPLVFGPEGTADIELPFGRSQTRYLILGLGNASIAGAQVTIEYSLRLNGRERVAASDPAAPSSTTYGTGVVVSGTVTCRGAPAPFADVLVTQTEVVSGATTQFQVHTDRNGRWVQRVVPEATTTYRGEVVDPLLSASASGAATVGVRVLVTATPERARVELGDALRVSGEVHPSHPGANVVVEFRRPDRPWNRGAETTVGPDGRYAAEVMLPAEGIWLVRTRVTDTGDRDHLPGASGTRAIEVTPP